MDTDEKTVAKKTAKKEKAPAKAAPSRRKTREDNQPAPPKLKLLFTVVPRQRAELYEALIEQFDVNMQLTLNADGTAKKEMLAYLGLNDTSKALIISVIREDKCDAALKYLEEKFHTVKNGWGIAFTSPMTSIIGVAIYQFLSNNSDKTGG